MDKKPWQPNASWQVKVDAIHRALNSAYLGGDIETSRFQYIKQQKNCCFIRIGKFRDNERFRPKDCFTNTKNQEESRPSKPTIPDLASLQEALRPLIVDSSMKKPPPSSPTTPTLPPKQSNNDEETDIEEQESPLVVFPDEMLEENMLLQTIINQILLPTIFKPECLEEDFWREPKDFGDIPGALEEISLIQRWKTTT